MVRLEYITNKERIEKHVKCLKKEGILIGLEIQEIMAFINQTKPIEVLFIGCICVDNMVAINKVLYKKWKETAKNIPEIYKIVKEHKNEGVYITKLHLIELGE